MRTSHNFRNELKETDRWEDVSKPEAVAQVILFFAFVVESVVADGFGSDFAAVRAAFRAQVLDEMGKATTNDAADQAEVWRECELVFSEYSRIAARFQGGKAIPAVAVRAVQLIFDEADLPDPLPLSLLLLRAEALKENFSDMGRGIEVLSA